MKRQLLLPLPMEFISAVEIPTDFAPCPPDIVVVKTPDTLAGRAAGVLTLFVRAGIFT
jgi:hypothetical protein